MTRYKQLGLLTFHNHNILAAFSSQLTHHTMTDWPFTAYSTKQTSFVVPTVVVTKVCTSDLSRAQLIFPPSSIKRNSQLSKRSCKHVIVSALRVTGSMLTFQHIPTGSSTMRLREMRLCLSPFCTTKASAVADNISNGPFAKFANLCFFSSVP